MAALAAPTQEPPTFKALCANEDRGGLCYSKMELRNNQVTIKTITEAKFLASWPLACTITILVMGLTSGVIRNALGMMKDATSRMDFRPCLLYKWKAGRSVFGYNAAMRAAPAAGAVLEDLCRKLSAQGHQLVLVGHSLGCVVVGSMLENSPTLAVNRVKQVVLSSGAERQGHMAKVLDNVALGANRVFILASSQDPALTVAGIFPPRVGPKIGSHLLSVCLSRQAPAQFTTLGIDALDSGLLGHGAPFKSSRHAMLIQQAHDSNDWFVEENHQHTEVSKFVNANVLRGRKRVSLPQLYEGLVQSYPIVMSDEE